MPSSNRSLTESIQEIAEVMLRVRPAVRAREGPNYVANHFCRLHFQARVYSFRFQTIHNKFTLWAPGPDATRTM